MSKLTKFIDHLSSITVAAQEEAMLKIIRENSHTMIDLNTGQLMNGVDANNKMLEHYHSPLYAALKLTLNPKGVTDLKLEGGFHEGFFQTANKFPVMLDSKDNKRNELVEKYGEDIFGLNSESKKAFRDFTEHSVRDYYTKFVLKAD